MTAPLDMVLEGGSVIDGSGSPAYVADIGIRGTSIEIIRSEVSDDARERVDVTGLCVAPGFIDVHTHSDLAPLLGDAHEDLQRASLRQGVTTEICGNCGFSVFPTTAANHADIQRYLRVLFGPTATAYRSLDDYRTAVEDAGLSTNLASLIGHGTIRAGVLGFADRPADSSELRAMYAATARALDDGAIGLSSGLMYAPGAYAPGHELVELARASAQRGRPYVSHIRDEFDHVDAAIDEALGVARESGAAVQISHHKTAGRRNWGRTTETLARITRAREAGIDVTVDVYPYNAGSTILAALLPPWANDGGIDELLIRLASPKVRDRLRRDFRDGLDGWQRLVEADGWGDVRIATAPRHRELEGQTIAAIAERQQADAIDVVADLLRAEEGQTTVVVFDMAEEDVARVVASPLAMFGSDGVPLPGKPHPRWAGSFARVLGRYVRDAGLVTLEDAVRRMTSFPADRFGLTRRGRLAEGMAADIVVFDPATVEDVATYNDPLQPPRGIHHVLVNGRLGVRDGVPTGTQGGAFITA